LRADFDSKGDGVAQVMAKGDPMHTQSQNVDGRARPRPGKRNWGIDPRYLEPSNPCDDILNPEQWAEVADKLRLTPRELEVTVLTMEGKTQTAIARRLRLNARTVRQYVEHVFAKAAVRHRLALAFRIIRVRDMCTVS
jgi:DNA-binding CsgD family transcriptional regulator